MVVVGSAIASELLNRIEYGFICEQSLTVIASPSGGLLGGINLLTDSLVELATCPHANV
jgi:hypothetical protein